MNLPFQIIFCDLDGTLFDERMQLSEENARAIHRMTEAGVLFVPNTGRGYGEIPDSIRENPDIRYCIYSDGTVIYDRLTDTYDTVCMGKELSHPLLELLAEYDSYLSVHAENVAYVDRSRTNEETLRGYQTSETIRQYLRDTNLAVDGFDAFCRSLDEIELICAFFHSEEDREACRRRLAKMDRLTVVTSIPHTLEILRADAGKGNALHRFAARMGVELAQTVAFGDSGNDAAMLRAAGKGFAVQNAWEELKAVADEVLPITNEEHVMQYVLERFWQ